VVSCLMHEKAELQAINQLGLKGYLGWVAVTAISKHHGSVLTICKTALDKLRLSYILESLECCVVTTTPLIIHFFFQEAFRS